MSGCTIGGYSVHFPAGMRPFPPQLAVMSRALTALKKGECALLESPTGTGKTLALLCSALSWQLPYRAQAYNQSNPTAPPTHTLQYEEEATHPHELDYLDENYGCESMDEDDSDAHSHTNHKSTHPSHSTDSTTSHPKKKQKKVKVPKIFFASRTHSQLAQVVSELKGCAGEYLDAYGGLKMTILGSRKHSCIHKAVSKATSVDEECRKLRKEGPCPHELRVHMVKGALPNVWDIEDLVSASKQVKGCGYFASHKEVEKAHLILCPYNYLVDPVIRKSLNLDVEGATLVFDETHNIESVCRDSASTDLDVDHLDSLVAELNALNEAGVESVSCVRVSAVVSGLSGWVHSVTDLLEASGYEEETKVWSGQEALALLAPSTGITPSTVGEFVEWVECICSAGEGSEESGGEIQGLTSMGRLTLTSLSTVLAFMMGGDLSSLTAYHMVVRRSRVTAPPTASKSRGGRGRGGQSVSGFKLELCLWCMSGGVAFSPLAELAHSILLTSGTLSPLSSFAHELKTDIPIKLEAGHVVDLSKQVWAGCIASACGVSLLSNYQSQHSLKYQDSLATSLMHIARVTPGGMLVFFPSYGLMTKMKQRWESTGALTQIQMHKKVFTEPKGSGDDLDKMLHQYMATIRTTDSWIPSHTQSVSDEVKKEGTPPSVKNGAMLLAVCRGKVSEGIDFADDAARAVVIVGIPYPHWKDLKVKLKREYQDSLCREASASRPSCLEMGAWDSDGRGSPAATDALDGDVWYRQQAFRALNQAVGRCVRHRRDYGALILADPRFQRMDVASSMSKWLRPCLKNYRTMESAIQPLTQFFMDNEPSRIRLQLDANGLKREKVAKRGGVSDAKPQPVVKKQSKKTRKEHTFTLTQFFDDSPPSHADSEPPVPDGVACSEKIIPSPSLPTPTSVISMNSEAKENMKPDPAVPAISSTAPLTSMPSTPHPTKKRSHSPSPAPVPTPHSSVQKRTKHATPCSRMKAKPTHQKKATAPSPATKKPASLLDDDDDFVSPSAPTQHRKKKRAKSRT